MPKLLILFVSILILPCTQSFAYSVIKDFKLFTKEEQVVIKLNINKEPEYKVTSLSNPNRVLIDLTDTRLNTSKKYEKTVEDVDKVRFGIQNGFDLRMVLDLASTKLFLISEDYKSGHLTLVFSKVKQQAKNKKIIVIDPGHGGKDEGTRGMYFDTREKELTLEVSKLLQKKLHKSGNYKVVLTRSADEFVHLKDRAALAEKHKADLFISIHADANPDASLQGLSVYTLSEKASDKESEKLAQDAQKFEEQNKTNFKTENKAVNEILNDIAHRQKLNNSASFASMLVGELSSDIKKLSKAHRFANFKVLKNANSPAVLIELGYLSNTEEEKLLQTKKYQHKLADTISRAIDKQFNINQKL